MTQKTIQGVVLVKYLNKEYKNLQELKNHYRQLILKFHPDRGGSNEVTAKINKEYEDLFKQVKEGSNEKSDFYQNLDDEFRNIINKLVTIEGIEIEVCGNWIWIDGNTYPVKDQLKEVGLYWAPEKKKWYWRPKEYKSYNSKNTYSMDKIREKYGSKKVKKKEVKKLTI